MTIPCHKNLSNNVGSSMKSSLSTGISNLDPFFGAFKQGFELHNFELTFWLDPFNWFKVFSQAGLFLSFSEMFQSSRSTFGPAFSTFQLVLQSFFLFCIFTLKEIGKVGNTPMSIISDFQKFGIFSQNSFMKFDLWNGFLLKFWNDLTVTNTFNFAYSHAINLIVVAKPKTYQLLEIYDPTSALWADLDPIFKKGIIKWLIPSSDALLAFPSGEIKSTELYDIFDATLVQPQILKWYYFLNHSDSLFECENIDMNWFNQFFDMSALMAGTPNPISINGNPLGISGVLSNMNSISPTTTAFCMTLLNVNYDMSTNCNFFSLISLYSPLLPSGSNFLSNYTIDREILLAIIGISKPPSRSKAQQERSSNRTNRPSKEQNKAGKPATQPEAISVDDVKLQDVSEIKSIFDNSLLRGIGYHERNMVLNTLLDLVTFVTKAKNSSSSLILNTQN
jgi:hypothetical protein